jgi:ferredoxin-nitrate reductase
VATGETETRTLCPYCGVGCGLLARTDGGRLREVDGDPLYPVNRGRTCRKPLELPAAVHAPDRALAPLVRDRRDIRFTDTSWDDAIGTVADRLRSIIDAHGPEAIAFYISGQLLTEDYYTVNKLAKGFLGTNNVDSNSRLCMSSAVAGYTGAFGSDGPPPSYRDVELADCIMLVGSNAAACHPIVWQRIAARRREGAFVICADPRPTPTARGSDLHLQVRPGTDLALLNAMLHVVVRDRLTDERFLAARTSGFEEAAAVAAEWTPGRAGEVCGVPAEQIEAAARRFATAATSVALWSMGANQSAVGTLKNRALINLCLATGQIGRPGAGPLSLTGQPNAMGGRETGGLAHLLPGYRRVQDAAHRAEMERHWGCPPIAEQPGLPAVELFDALAAGRVKAVWIVATNPLVSLPDARRARAALERAELVVVQDAHHPTETSSLAHVLLPAAAWPEKTGTMTNSERRVGLVRRALPPPGEALPDWRIFQRAAHAFGFGPAFAWSDEAEVFDEFAACTAGRPCDLSGISHARLEREGSLQWPCPAAAAEPHAGTERLYGEGARFHTGDGRARFAPTPHAGPAEQPDATRPLTLTTGRLAEHWHTLSRTGKSARLRGAAAEPLLELSGGDAARAGLRDGERAVVRSARGEVELAVQVVDGMPDGVAFAPMHWGALHAAPGAGAVNELTLPACDPVSRQPELKASAVAVTRARARGPRPHRPAPRRLVVVGAGMAGLAVVEEALRHRPADAWSITLLGEEPELPYNRILLSKQLALTCGPSELALRPAAWFAAHGVRLALGCAASTLDLDARVVTDADDAGHPYDALVLATGSRSFVPPVPGIDGPQVHGFRTRADLDAIAARTVPGARAAVLGGGLLGLEAAAGLRARGMRVTVIERAPILMPQQLDAGASALLERALAGLGLSVRLGAAAAAVERDAVVLDGGERVAAELVVVAAGVRPEVSLARAAGLEVGRGVLVVDELRAGAPGVWAVGECAEHRGVVQGLWAPVAAQARVAGASVAGAPAAFHGAVTATTLKVAGVDVFAGGAAVASAGLDEIVASNTRRGTYRRLLLDGDRLAGAILVGEIGQARALSELLRCHEPVPDALIDQSVSAGGPGAGLPPEPAAVVCSCNAVTRGEIDRAIRARGLTTVLEVARATGATTGCGSCARDVDAILRARSSDGNTGGTDAKSLPGTIAA